MKRLILILLLLSVAASAQIARTGSCAAGSSACTLSATAANDLQLVIVYRTSSTTAPSLAAGWTNVTNSTSGTPSYRVACRVASSSADTSVSGFTNGNIIAAFSYSGTSATSTATCNTDAVGATALSAAISGTTVNFPALTLQQTSGLDWVAALMWNNANGTCAPSALTTVNTATNLTSYDTNGGVASFPATSCTASASATNGRVLEVEIKTTAVTVADPVISSSGSTVTIADATSGATICYREDGTNPSASVNGTCDAGSTTYTGPFTRSTNVVKALGTKASSVNSAVVTYNFAATPTISLASGTYFTQQSVTLSCSTGSSSIYYTTDGSTPTTSSTLYTGAFNTVNSAAETVKALCTASGYGDSSVASATYSIAPSDVAIVTSNFSDVYDSNLALNWVQQLPLDTVQTSGKWKAAGGITADVGWDDAINGAIAPVRPAVRAAVTSGYAVGTASGLQIAAYTGRSGMANDGYSTVKLPGGNGGAALVSTDGTKTAYYFMSGCSPTGSNTYTIFKVVNGGTPSSLASGSGTVTCGSGLELRGVGENPVRLQALLNGSAVLEATDSSSPISSRTCGIAVNGGYVSDFSCGNVGVADGSSVATYTPTYPTYTDAAMSTSSWAQTWPWFLAALPHTDAGVIAWNFGFAPVQIVGSLYGIGIPVIGSGTISYRGGEFGSNQWQKYKIGINPDSAGLNNWFTPLQHQTYVPGTGVGGCPTAHMYDSVSYYPGVETFYKMIASQGRATACDGGTKPEYACTPFMHITKVTPAASPCDEVVTVMGSFYTPLKGDELYVEYVAPKLNVACKGASTPTAIARNTTYTANEYHKDPSGNLQRVITGGTTGASAPSSWGSVWNIPNMGEGERTTDGTVTWEFFGQACPTTDKFSWVINATDSDLAGAKGVPALWEGTGGVGVTSTPVPLFYDWSAGTATTLTACSLDANLCTTGSKQIEDELW